MRAKRSIQEDSMAENVVAADRWGQLIYDEERKSLELRWLPSTTDGTDAELQATMLAFAEEAIRLKPQSLIVDVSEFHHRFGDGMEPWRAVEIIPRYNKAGVTKMAFI